MRVRFLGHLKNIFDDGLMSLSGVGGRKLRDVLSMIYDLLGKASNEIFNGSPDRIRSSIILLVNEVSYDILGLDYVVSEDDELIFIPSVHGG
ncbi:MAG: MoaD/ThiS family protein [archaeon YNP-LCB-003-016]|uniref:MoaD/ThiS family protein n=1 Tax=Candidatus Culexarchaeum yellowstonense TaxID=2928963 RepID=UPI0026EE86B0|nr:MoaD/ThiS family protein [Candidatus Culexarchaeum yellowstonense]MCR6691317.1 MoaD/ThiS family protein [Candidatus Culexarchaeum yellowstonense]